MNILNRNNILRYWICYWNVCFLSFFIYAILFSVSFFFSWIIMDRRQFFKENKQFYARLKFWLGISLEPWKLGSLWQPLDQGGRDWTGQLDKLASFWPAAWNKRWLRALPFVIFSWKLSVGRSTHPNSRTFWLSKAKWLPC